MGAARRGRTNRSRSRRARTIVDKQHDGRLPVADAIAEQRIRARDPSVAAFDGDLDALKQQLRDIRDDYPYACICEDAG